MIGKLIEGVLLTPSEDERNKIIITNASDEILVATRGYKYVYYDEKPEYDAETQYLKEDAEEMDEAIYVHYIVENIPVEELESVGDSINEVTESAD